MVMATRAANGHPEHRRADRVHHVIEFVVARRFKFLLSQLCREHARTEETGGHHREWIVRFNLVAGNLPAHKLVIRHIVVQRLDDKVAVVIGVMPVGVLLEAETVRVTGEVEPVAPPAFAVVRRVEQAIDNALKRRTRIAIGHGKKRLRLLRGRRQADQVKVNTAQQRPVFRRAIWFQIGLLQFG